MIPFRNHNGTKAKDGWNGFNLEPPPWTDILVYVDDDDGYWIEKCQWDPYNKRLIGLDGIIAFSGLVSIHPNARPLFWRYQPDEPSAQRMKEARKRKPIECLSRFDFDRLPNQATPASAHHSSQN